MHRGSVARNVRLEYATNMPGSPAQSVYRYGFPGEGVSPSLCLQFRDNSPVTGDWLLVDRVL